MQSFARIPAVRRVLLVLVAGASALALAGPGVPREEPVVRINTNEVIARLTTPLAAQLIAERYGMAVKQTLKMGPDWVVFTCYSVEEALKAQKQMAKDPLVVAVDNNFLGGKRKLQAAFTPNDTYYLENNPPGFFGCWHLASNPTARANVNAQAAWSQGMTGQGVTLAICDDGVEREHPDLNPNFNYGMSYDFGEDDVDPSPLLPSDNHGTACAGVAAARGGNSLGVVGAAPYGSLVGLRMNFGGSGQQFVDVIGFYSSGPIDQRKIMVKSHSYTGGPYGSSPLEGSATLASADAGTIHCWGAGNFRGTESEDSNKLEPQNSPGAITVAALGADGKFSYYSSFGQNVFAAVPSSGDGTPSILTVDRTGNAGYNDGAGSIPFPNADYNNTFGGTSSSAPLAAGVMALFKQRCPAADQRLAKHLMVRTNRMVDEFDSTESSDGGWRMNGGGYWFNPNYGFGLLDAGAMVTEGKKYYAALPKVTRTINGTVNAAIPDQGSVTRTFTTFATVGRVPLEEVTVRLRATHPVQGQLAGYLTSPSGQKRRLMNAAPAVTGNLDWTFVTYAFWGEDPLGTWTLELADTVAGDTGTWTDYQVVMGFGTPGSRLGSGILSHNPSTSDVTYTGLYNSRNYTTQALPAKPAIPGAKPVAIGDLDLDGRNDILYQGSNGALTYQTLYGYSVKSEDSLGSLGSTRVAFGIADVNRDGKTDILLRTLATGAISYSPLNGTRTALGTAVTIGTPPAGTIPFGVADSTGDGQVDILLDKTTASRAVWIWQLNYGGTPFGFIFSGYQVPGYTLCGIADLNFDNQPDFIARNDTTGAAAGYTMNILTIKTISTLTTVPAGHTVVGGAAL